MAVAITKSDIAKFKTTLQTQGVEAMYQQIAALGYEYPKLALSVVTQDAFSGRVAVQFMRQQSEINNREFTDLEAKKINAAMADSYLTAMTKFLSRDNAPTSITQDLDFKLTKEFHQEAFQKAGYDISYWTMTPIEELYTPEQMETFWRNDVLSSDHWVALTVAKVSAFSLYEKFNFSGAFMPGFYASAAGSITGEPAYSLGISRPYFSGDTMVWMADGSYKAMSQVISGDQVRGYDSNNNIVINTVKANYSMEQKSLLTGYINQSNGQKIYLTDDVRVLAKDGTYKSIYELQQETALNTDIAIEFYNENNQLIKVVPFEFLPQNANKKQYSLDVSGTSNYGIKGGHVHNDGTFLSETSDAVAQYLKETFGDNIVIQSLGNGTSLVLSTFDEIYQPIKNALHTIDEALSFTQTLIRNETFNFFASGIKQFGPNIIADLIMGKPLDEVITKYTLQISTKYGLTKATEAAGIVMHDAVMRGVSQFIVTAFFMGQKLKTGDYAKLAGNIALQETMTAVIKSTSIGSKTDKFGNLSPEASGAIAAAVVLAQNIFGRGFEKFDQTLAQATVAAASAVASSMVTTAAMTAFSVGAQSIGAVLLPGIGIVVGAVIGKVLSEYVYDGKSLAAFLSVGAVGAMALKLAEGSPKTFAHVTADLAGNTFKTDTWVKNGAGYNSMDYLMGIAAYNLKGILEQTGQVMQNAKNTEFYFKEEHDFLRVNYAPAGTNQYVEDHSVHGITAYVPEQKIAEAEKLQQTARAEAMQKTNAQWMQEIDAMVVKMTKLIEFKDADVFIGKAIAGATNSAAINDNILTAQQYAVYLQHKDEIDTLIAASPFSTEAMLWQAMVDEGKKIGLDTITDMTFKGNYAKADDDVLHGLSGNDTLWGYAGNDLLNGRAGRDKILGGDGDDTLSGDEGDDIIEGGRGHNVLTGGAGVESGKIIQLTAVGKLRNKAFSHMRRYNSKMVLCKNTRLNSAAENVLKTGRMIREAAVNVRIKTFSVCVQ